MCYDLDSDFAVDLVLEVFVSKKIESLKASINKDELSLKQSKAKLLQIRNTEKSALGVAARKINTRKKIFTRCASNEKDAC